MSHTLQKKKLFTMLAFCVCLSPLVATDGSVVKPIVDATTCATPPAKPAKKEKVKKKKTDTKTENADKKTGGQKTSTPDTKKYKKNKTQ